MKVTKEEKKIIELVEEIVKAGYVVTIASGSSYSYGTLATHNDGSIMGTTGESMREAIERLAELIKRKL